MGKYFAIGYFHHQQCKSLLIICFSLRVKDAIVDRLREKEARPQRARRFGAVSTCFGKMKMQKYLLIHPAIL
jgi:hypothetical protein